MRRARGVSSTASEVAAQIHAAIERRDLVGVAVRTAWAAASARRCAARAPGSSAGDRPRGSRSRRSRTRSALPGSRSSAAASPASRIFTIDLMLLKPYFHGTTRRSGAPFWLGSVAPVHADREDRERVHGLVHAQAFAVRPVAGSRGAARASARDRRASRRPRTSRASSARSARAPRRAGCRATGSPSTTPRRSAGGRCAPRAGAARAASRAARRRASRPRPRSPPTTASAAALPAFAAGSSLSVPNS